MRQRFFNQKGVTLIELIITMAILSIVLIGVYSFLKVGNNSFRLGSRQYYSQSEVRLAIDTISKEIRYATDVELLSTKPSSISDTDTFNYFYIEDGSLVHSVYNGGSARNVHAYGIGIQDASNFNKMQVGEYQSIDFQMLALNGNQDYELHAELAMPNINLNENYIVDVSDAVAVKYYKNTDLDYIPPEDEEDEDEDEDPESYYVTVTVNFPTNNYKMDFDGIEYSVSSKKVVITNVLGGSSGTDHTISFYYKQGSAYHYHRDEVITAYEADITYEYAGH